MINGKKKIKMEIKGQIKNVELEINEHFLKKENSVKCRKSWS